MAHDVRAIANWVLDQSDRAKRHLTNFSVNKVVFFLHADYLLQVRRPLVTAKVEAWKHGPVFRELYAAFKEFGDNEVTSRIFKIDPTDGQRTLCVTSLARQEEEFLLEGWSRYGAMSVGALYSLSHEPDGPWDKAWNHEGQTNAFMRISDEAILEWWSNSQRH